jgi:predicted transcriptional regulator
MRSRLEIMRKTPAAVSLIGTLVLAYFERPATAVAGEFTRRHNALRERKVGEPAA